ncbi:hypothetical protein [Spongiactinospora sp. 9N601]|uniref:hypothetical protein n=1 Tax=Spongiactinospora sp. 9N601 TaxID=3375149 RepID=UPI00379D6D2A
MRRPPARAIVPASTRPRVNRLAQRLFAGRTGTGRPQATAQAGSAGVAPRALPGGQRPAARRPPV